MYKYQIFWLFLMASLEKKVPMIINFDKFT